MLHILRTYIPDLDEKSNKQTSKHVFMTNGDVMHPPDRLFPPSCLNEMHLPFWPGVWIFCYVCTEYASAGVGGLCCEGLWISLPGCTYIRSTGYVLAGESGLCSLSKHMVHPG